MKRFLSISFVASLLLACAALSPKTPTPAPVVAPTNTAAPPVAPTAAPTATLKPTATAYTREFPNTAGNDDILVGVYWYPWYGADGRHWNDGYLGTPTLGRYNSGDQATINQQIDWASGHGVDFFIASWWGPDSFEDSVLQRSFPKASLAGEIKFAVLYEAPGLLRAAGNGIDLSDAGNRDKLISDLRYIAKNYFDAPNYLRVNDRPVVFFYLTRIFFGDVAGAMQAAREAVKEETGDDLFIIGDEVYWQAPTDARLTLFDGVTAYNMHASVDDIADGFAAKVEEQYRQWSQAASTAGVTFVPDVIPGFDDTRVRPQDHHPVIPASVELFSDQLRTSLELATGEVRMITITSWNEWHEGTTVEPSEEYGFDYLDALQIALNGH